MNPGAMIPFHKHHNSEEVVIMEEGGATVTVGDKRAVTGPHAVVFIPRKVNILRACHIRDCCKSEAS